MIKLFIMYSSMLCALMLYCNSTNQVFLGAFWDALFSDDGSYHSSYRGWGGGGGFHK